MVLRLHECSLPGRTPRPEDREHGTKILLDALDEVLQGESISDER